MHFQVLIKFLSYSMSNSSCNSDNQTVLLRTVWPHGILPISRVIQLQLRQESAKCQLIYSYTLSYKMLQHFLSSSMSNSSFNSENQTIMLRTIWPVNGILPICRVIQLQLRQDQCQMLANTFLYNFHIKRYSNCYHLICPICVGISITKLPKLEFMDLDINQTFSMHLFNIIGFHYV